MGALQHNDVKNYYICFCVGYYGVENKEDVGYLQTYVWNI